MLRLLDLKPGARVMEVGTGSGYSGALLANVTGPEGYVVSIDVDPTLVERARNLHEKAGHSNVEVHAADGFEGCVESGPYDRIVGWTTPHLLPAHWIAQCKPGAVIVTPVKIADVAGTNAVLRCTVDGQPFGGELRPGSFIEMAPEVITDFGLPIRYVNAVRRLPDGPSWWLSAHELHDQPRTTAERLLDMLCESKPDQNFFSGTADDWRAFTSFVLASTPSVASAGGPIGWGVGVGTTESIAVCLRNGAVASAGTDSARDDLAALLAEWLDAGQPDLGDFAPEYARHDEGWAVRLRFREDR
jgi:protein-L-isoaspartate(D-aspartate) O-methyltransferase